jgi:hypothetical protein
MRSYPKYDLDSSIEVARRLHQHGGQASAVEMAAILNYKSTNNGAFLNRMAAARAFGLIEGEGKGAIIRVTKRGLDLIEPDYPATETRARLDAFTGVPLYAEFLGRYEGQPLPDRKGMENALASLAVPRGSVSIALSRLLSSAQQAGLFAVSANKMIRPTLAARPTPQVIEIGMATETDTAGTITVDKVQISKLIDGLIEELPTDREWDEDSLMEWLDLFQRALRVHYRLPRARGGGS